MEKELRTGLDKTILMPWESYSQCPELLRTNSRLERLYHNIVQ